MVRLGGWDGEIRGGEIRGMVILGGGKIMGMKRLRGGEIRGMVR